MSIVFSVLLLFLTTITCFFAISTSVLPALDPDELIALEKIATTLGVKGLDLSYDGDPCSYGSLKMMQEDAVEDMENSIGCNCSFNNKMTCHITNITLKTLSLPGSLPPELAKLQYLQSIDLCRNYLSGTIPMEWASMPYLTSISLCSNRLSGSLPRGLQNFKNLTFLGIEANNFSGPIPDELGNLTNLKGLQLGSNKFTGNLPTTLARLVNLEDFRVSDNNFNGIIPRYIGNWSRLKKLDLYASGLTGPIPDTFVRLEYLRELRISDTTGINSFPIISSKVIKTIILRNVGLYGSIPSYIWDKSYLKILDLSFNNLTTEVHGLERAPQYTYLTGNRLFGDVEYGISLNNKSNIDLSYNNLSWSSSCQEKSISNINTYRSSYLKNNLIGLLPCAGPINCTGYKKTLHINCGGDNIVVKKSSHKITYEADNSTTKAATNQHFTNWGISNTGEFLDSGDEDETYIITTSSTLSRDSSGLYKSARRSPLSLVYYAFCLENGAYNVKLHFMEIQFSDEKPYSRLGRRIFDVYVQGELFLKDFNIKENASGTLKPIVKEKKDVNVTNHMLEIRLYWAGKGTTLIPSRGNYGPLISAISLCHHSMGTLCGAEKIKHTKYPLIFGLVASITIILLLALGIYAHKRFIGDNNTRERDLRTQGLQTVCFTWRQLQAATNNFDQANKLGEGGFGSVFKGELSDGTIIAVKQLSSNSCQGNREFVNEIGNNFLRLDWAARQNICVGIARGLEFLHEGSMIKMVHRDIKTTNVLLDGNLNAKISDFGLARLHEEENSHITTKIAGTIGYMAPEYALWGQLTEKADVYSFGVVAMEIVSGKSNVRPKGSVDHISLINWALTLQQTGDIIEIIDPMLEGDFNSKEAERMIKVALVCTNSSPSLRPKMSEVVQMLEGDIEITQQVMSDPGLYGHNWSISNPRDIDTHGTSSTSGVTGQTSTRMKSSFSGSDLYPLYPNSTMEFSTSSL